MPKDVRSGYCILAGSSPKRGSDKVSYDAAVIGAGKPAFFDSELDQVIDCRHRLLHPTL